MLVRVALVGLGGALGAVARYLLGTWIATRVSPDFPWSTFLINISGSFLIGVILGLASAGQLSNEARLFLAVGVLGGYTTFSTFSYESLELLADGGEAFGEHPLLVADRLQAVFAIVTCATSIPFPRKPPSQYIR